MNNKIIIGLTGQTGAGKSTVAKFLKSRGYYIIDADICAREVVVPGSECLNSVTKEFGKDVLLPDGSLNRKKLGDIVFKSKKKLEKLSLIMNKYILKNINDKISSAHDNIIILDAPTLFESGADKFCKYTVSVIANSDIRRQRIMQRDSLSAIQAEDRINSQNNDDYYISKSDYVIINDSDKSALESKADSIINTVISKGK